MDGLTEFVEKYPQAWDNIQNDPSLSKKIKAEFIKHLKKYSKGAIEDHAKMFFHDERYLFIGSEIEVEDEILGRLESKDALKVRLTYVQNGGSIKANVAVLNQMFTGDKRKRLEVLKDSFGIEKIKEFVMWAFRNEHDKNNPYNNGILPTDLTCVLGLKEFRMPGIKLAYRLPDKRANKPTSINAGLNDAWRPGGRTDPLCKNGFPSACSRRHPAVGLPEVVHKPNTFNDIVLLEEL